VLDPRLTVWELGEAEILKSGFAPVTTSVTVVEWTNEPLVPVIVSVYVPTGVEAAVVTFMVLLPEPMTEVGLNEALAPVGRPLALKVTVPLKPPDAVTVAL